MSPLASAPSTGAVTPATVLAMSPEQVAQALGITRTKVFELLARKAIRSVKIGKYRRVPVAEVEAYLQHELEAQNDVRSA